MLSASDAKDRLEPATLEDAEQAIAVVMGALGHRMDAGRIATVALVLAGSDWTRAELRTASAALATSPTLRDHLRFGGTITPADFEDVRRGEEREERDEDGVRTVVTLKGYALNVRRQRLFGYQEALGLWTSMGSPGRFSDSLEEEHADATFRLVRVDGEDRPRWQLK